jgi:beta-xylosidase
MAAANPIASAPAYDGDFADPHVVRVGSDYFAYATNAAGANVQVMASRDLVSWRHLGDALPELPAWARPGFTWAPEVCERAGRWLLYYTVREPRSGRQCISVATSARPQGPFADRSSGPLVFQRDRGGSIDPSPFVDGDDIYLLWKSDDNALNRRSSIWGQALGTDGMTLRGTAVELLTHDRGWERPLIEAPSAVQHGGTRYLFYSANWWESEAYAIGYATGSAPLGPFRKATRWSPWLGSHGRATGPGGQAFFTDADGDWWMAYHAWWRGRVGYGQGGARCLWLSRVTFEGGRPTLVP